MRNNSRLLLLASFILSSISNLPQSFSAEAPKVIIGMDAPTLSDLPLSLALKKDFFKPEGLSVLPVLFRSGPTAMQALVSGSIQFSTGFGTGTRAAMAGAPVKGIIGFNNKPAFILYGRRESGIRSIADIKGKKIAVTGVGSTTDYAARAILTHNHVDPDKEVSILAVGSESVFAALQKGAVDAAILWAPGFAIAEKLGMVRLQSLADILELPGSGVVVSDQLIKENPLLIKKFLRGTVKGFHYVHDPKNKDEIVSSITKDFSLERDIADTNYKFMLSILSTDGNISQRAIENGIELTRQRVKTSESTSELIKKMYDFTLLEDVQRGK
ncbi:MAG TPA: ABC transporter substrate-binding protein [Candidatus Limnocylindrales bacterium]|nr:ABC transporter substrate-binding protein [Candidatus Limnocylindrales bacterium]